MCSVALYKGENLLAIKEQGGAYAHAENLTVFIQQVISDAQISFNQLSAIAVSKGPGSYTGLRIGVSTAKGLAYALNKPIIGIDTLTSMANLARQKINYQNEFLCPMIDARRMEVYCAIFDQNQNIIKPISADIITENVFDKYIGESKIVIFGDGSQKCKELFKNKTNYIFLQDEFISAKGLIIPALKKLNNNELDDVVYFEPFYLKDFISSSSKT